MSSEPNTTESLAPPGSEAAQTPVETPTVEADGGDEEAKQRKLRLNPTLDPEQFKARPNVTGLAGEVPVEEPAAPAPIVKEEPKAEAAPPPPPAKAIEIPRDVDLDAQTEAEIAAAFASGEMEHAPEATTVPEAGDEGEAVAEKLPEGELAQGTKLKAKVQSIHGDNVFVDLGVRTTGVVSLRQFNPQKPPKEGDQVDVIVDRLDEKDGLTLCNLPRGKSRISGDWDALSVGQVVEGMVEKTNKGGLEVKIGSLRAFMPASQVELGYVANLDSYIGQKVRAKITEVKPARRRLILSRRELLAEERADAEKEAMTTLEPGQQMTGRVKTIKDYGAFIDLGGVDGFLHIGQMSWVRINHPSEVVKEGDTVQVQVLSIDKDSKKISLGMRQLSANPWTLADSKYAKGTNVTGKVTRTEPFGAFIELEPGVEGLVHISELDHKRVKRVTEVLNAGQMVECQVLEVDPGRKRISLSVKALKAKPEVAPKPTDEDLAPGKGQAYERKIKGPLKGGIGANTPSGLFGNPRDFTSKAD
jgi:small subunit ribosomal protein S1